MRCRCDAMLSDYDLRRKCKHTGEHLDMCSLCYRASESARWEAEQDNNDAVARREADNGES